MWLEADRIRGGVADSLDGLAPRYLRVSEAERKALGIPEGLIRYSVGIENVEDLRTDLQSALSDG